MSGYVGEKERVMLALRSGGYCALCKTELFVPATEKDAAQILGKVAHIKGEKKDSARYDKDQPGTEKSVYANLIYTCGDCHTKIDGQENSFSVEDLLDAKAQHEKWVQAKLGESTVAVGFSELDMIAKFVLAKPHDPTMDFTVLGPEEKMRKNDLGPAVLEEFKMGYGKANEVQLYVDVQTSIDPEFPERLKAGFVNQYHELRGKGLRGDALFLGLREFASRGSVDFMKQAAGLAILTYLFQKCEVFEH